MTQPPTGVRAWLTATDAGLYCAAGDFYIDPVQPVERAVITHGHGDHARPGHGTVLATPETAAIMRQRYGTGAAGRVQTLGYGEVVTVGDVALRLAPAGHVLGSAQVVLEHGGARAVVSGDYKREEDPTCPGFEPVPCDVFVTEATFALPVFRRPPPGREIARLHDSLALFPERSHLIGSYPLGKAQRVIAELRRSGFDAPIYLHGALQGLCDLYRRHGVALGELRSATGAPKRELAGAVVMAPPSALKDPWARRLSDPVLAMASGWLQVRQRVRQRGVELPLVISDHADWDGLCATVQEVGCAELWITHGRDDALGHWARQQGVQAEALNLVGYAEEEEELGDADTSGAGEPAS